MLFWCGVVWCGGQSKVGGGGEGPNVRASSVLGG